MEEPTAESLDDQMLTFPSFQTSHLEVLPVEQRSALTDSLIARIALVDMIPFRSRCLRWVIEYGTGTRILIAVEAAPGF